jgi:sigma-B regulation protein RsbU (phosphoserine phosphatase)
MPKKQHQKNDSRRARNGERFRFIAETSDSLALADDPLEALDAALPAVAALLGNGSGRPRREAVEPDLRVLVRDGEELYATVEVTTGPGAAALDETETLFLKALSRVASLALAKSKLDERLGKEQRIGRDLESAAELQRSLQPDCLSDDLPIWGVNLPARQLSGDFFDFYRLDDDRIVFTLGDVSGKGIKAALLMAKTVSLFRCLSKRIDSPAELLAAVNDELCETATRGMFVTMVAGHYHPRSGRVGFANAGHQPPLLRRLDRSYERFPATAPPLGILPSLSLVDEKIELAGGEFYVFTDGLTEYRYADGEQLGVDGFIQLVEMFAKESPARRLELILETLDQEGGWVARDDLTVLAIDDSMVRHGATSERGGDAGLALAAVGEARR